MDRPRARAIAARFAGPRLRPQSRPLFVILSVAKDLIADCHGHEVLRYAQDDRRNYTFIFVIEPMSGPCS